MSGRKVFYSFCFRDDVMRVQLIRNIGAIDANKPVTPNNWEEVQKSGTAAIKKWIDENMRNRSCVVVLVGSRTAKRRWVKYEIQKAWNEGKGVVGIYIHNLRCPRNGFGSQGDNPFEEFLVGRKRLSNIVKCYDPDPDDAYNDIKRNLERWIERAITIRARY